MELILSWVSHTTAELNFIYKHVEKYFITIQISCRNLAAALF